MIDNTKNPNGKGWYSNLFRRAEWAVFRGKVIEAAGNKCEDCGSDVDLQAHHIFYLIGRMPWDYPLALMRCTCCNCHLPRQTIEQEIMINVATILRDKSVAELKGFPIYTFFRSDA